MRATTTSLTFARGICRPHVRTVDSAHEEPAAGWKGCPLGSSTIGLEPAYTGQPWSAERVTDPGVTAWAAASKTVAVTTVGTGSAAAGAASTTAPSATADATTPTNARRRSGRIPERQSVRCLSLSTRARAGRTGALLDRHRLEAR